MIDNLGKKGMRKPSYEQMEGILQRFVKGNDSLARLAAAQGQALGRIKLHCVELIELIRGSSFALPREIKIADALEQMMANCGKSEELLDIQTALRLAKPEDSKQDSH